MQNFMTRERFINYLTERDVVTPEIQNVLSVTPPIAREPIGMISVQHGLIRGHQIDEILDAQRSNRLRFGDLAVQMNLLTREQVDHLVQIQKFRVIADLAESLVLSGLVNFNEALEHLGSFLQDECDDKTGSQVASTT